MEVLLETERLIFRELTLADAKGMFELDANPKVHQYLGNNPVKTIAESRKAIQFVMDQYHRNGIGRWAVVLKDNQEFIGWAGLKFVDEMPINGQRNFYDLGYRFIEKYWRKGYGYEAAQALVTYGFEKLNLTKISAFIDPKNQGSRRILEKCGLQFITAFEYEGVICDWFEVDKKLFPKEVSLKTKERLLIREAKVEDAPSLIKYFNQIGSETNFVSFGPNAYHKTVAEEINNINTHRQKDNHIYLIAELDGQIAGVLNVHALARPRLAHIGEFGISVLQQFWGKGIGNQLMQCMMEWAKATKIIRKINLIVNTTNQKGIDLYHKFGFEIEGKIRRGICIDGQFIDNYFMGIEID